LIRSEGAVTAARYRATEQHKLHWIKHNRHTQKYSTIEETKNTDSKAIAKRRPHSGTNRKGKQANVKGY